jgi:hypothetical protein
LHGISLKAEGLAASQERFLSMEFVGFFLNQKFILEM